MSVSVGGRVDGRVCGLAGGWVSRWMGVAGLVWVGGWVGGCGWVWMGELAGGFCKLERVCGGCGCGNTYI